jgi:hypothetical protein
MKLLNNFQGMRASFVFLSFVLFCSTAFGQVQKIAGKIVDAASGEPLLGVAVYISGTSTGVVSGIDGSYTINYSLEFNAPLVFAYLGYEKIQILDPTNVNLKLVKMTEQTNALEAVVIDPDPWDRATKEQVFLQYFVGASTLEHCKVSNLKDIRLRFNPTTRLLTAVANNPIVLTNTDLGYLITYDLSEFEVSFEFFPTQNGIEKIFKLEHARDRYRAETSFVSGTSFYQEYAGIKPTERQRERRREKAYERSQLKLYRALINETLNEDKFELFFNGFKVNPTDHIRVRKEGDVYKVVFRNLKYSILDRSQNQTDLFLTSNFIYMDSYGNDLSPRLMKLSGYIPQLGVGGMMPLDYNLNTAQ